MTGQELEHSGLLTEILDNKQKGYILEGGSRSSKTWSIIQYLMLYCQAETGKEITICRDRLTWLKLTVLRDFKEILIKLGWWIDKDFNQSEMTYKLFGNRFTFVGLDEPAKLHGLTQDVFWINEAIGTPGSAYNPTLDNFDQLEMRTKEGFFLDYNPKVTEHWIYEKVQTRPDVYFIHSTQLDNPFLEQTIREKILSYEPTPANVKRGTSDDIKWKIYGLGIRAQHEGVIFTNINYVKEIPEEATLVAFGLDFGFTNDPTSLVKVCMLSGELWVDEIIYETGLTNPDIYAKSKDIIGKFEDVIADSAEPKSIKELQMMGMRIEGANKGPDSIRAGIDVLKRYRVNITERSMNIKREYDNYCWKVNKQTQKSEGVPIDTFNHAIDAIRYVALNRLQDVRAPMKFKAFGA